MREDTPGNIFEPVPLFEEIVAAMVANGLDMVAVTDADFPEVRSVNNQFPAIREHGFELIHAFARGPKFVVHWRAAGDDGLKRLFFVGDVEFAGEVAGFVPGLLRRSGEKAGEIFLRVNDHAKTKFIRVDHRPGAIDHFAHRRPFIPDDHRVGNDRAQPMEEVQYRRAADAREKIFIATGKANDLMWENRADDDDFVVFENLLVDFDRHLHREKAVGELTDFFGAERANAFEGGGIAPLVVVKADSSEFVSSLRLRYFEPFTNTSLVHRLVCAKGDEHIEGFCDSAGEGMEGLEHRSDGCSARTVGDDEEDGFVSVVGLATGAVNDFSDLNIRNRAFFARSKLKRSHRAIR